MYIRSDAKQNTKTSIKKKIARQKNLRRKKTLLNANMQHLHFHDISASRCATQSCPDIRIVCVEGSCIVLNICYLHEKIPTARHPISFSLTDVSWIFIMINNFLVISCDANNATSHVQCAWPQQRAKSEHSRLLIIVPRAVQLQRIVGARIKITLALILNGWF